MDWKTLLKTASIVAAKVALGVIAVAVIDRIKRELNDGDFDQMLRKWL